jgi:formate--tetrahydrofolate ligase
MPASQHQNPKSDIEISQDAKKRRILDVAKDKLGIAAREPRTLRPLQGQGLDGLRQVAQGQEERQADPGDGDLADARRAKARRRRPVGLTDALNHIGKKGDCARCASPRSVPRSA